MTIEWREPPNNGGFFVLYYKIYVNNAILDGHVEATEKTYLMTALTLGTSYKILISSVNEVGESAKSESNTILFSNIPSAPASLVLASIVETKEQPYIRATWTAPTQLNGDAVKGYKLYIDDGEGGDYTLVYDGTGFPNVYQFIIKEQIACGVVYNVKVTAINYAGESAPTLQRMRVGKPSSVPLYLKWTKIVPEASISLSWAAPVDNGCLPLVSYVMNKNGVDMVDIIAPNELSFTDTHLTSSNARIGTVITYKIKTTNYAGESRYSEPLTITVGVVPNDPANLRISS